MAGTYRKERKGGEGLSRRQLVAQQHIHGEGAHRHKGGDGVQQEAVEGLHSEGLPEGVQLGVPHLLDALPEGRLPATNSCQTGKQAGRQKAEGRGQKAEGRQAGKVNSCLSDRQAGRQTDTQTDTQTHRRAGRHSKRALTVFWQYKYAYWASNVQGIRPDESPLKVAVLSVHWTVVCPKRCYRPCNTA